MKWLVNLGTNKGFIASWIVDNSSCFNIKENRKWLLNLEKNTNRDFKDDEEVLLEMKENRGDFWDVLVTGSRIIITWFLPISEEEAISGASNIVQYPRLPLRDSFLNGIRATARRFIHECI
jgi:hypothetical protein